MTESLNFEFERIDGNNEQAEKLYKLLQKRVHSISHKNVPDFATHLNFVRNHPYLCWYIVKHGGHLCGAFYIKKDNSIGMNFIVESNEIVAACIDFIYKHFTPLNAQASIIPEYFYINVAASNVELIKILRSLNKSPFQIGFRI